MHTKNIRRPRITTRSPRISDGQRHPVTVRHAFPS